MNQLIGTLSCGDTLIGVMSVPPERGTNPYVGSYEWTPTENTQTISINGLRATADIIINPIPNNYGLITWDGSALTVS